MPVSMAPFISNDPYFNDGTGKVYGYDFEDWVR